MIDIKRLKSFRTKLSSISLQLPNIELSRKRILKGIGFLCAAIFLAAAQFHMIQEAFGPDNIRKQIAATQGLIDGIPQLGGHMHRLIGPYMVEGMHRLTGWDFETSHHVVTFLLLLVFFLIITLIAHSIFKSKMAALATAMAAGFLNAFLLQGAWLYLWDIINLSIFAVLIWGIMTRKPLWLIYLLIVIEIFNHDFAFIIISWLILDATIRLRYTDRRFPTINLRFKLRQLLLGIGLGAGAYFIKIWLRDKLLIAPYMKDSILASHEKWGVELWYLTEDYPLTIKWNLELLKTSFLFDSESSLWASRFFSNNLIIFNPLIVGIPIICIIGILSRNVNIYRISVLFFMLWGAALGTCLIYETRVWLPFVPYFVLVAPLIFMNMFSSKSDILPQYVESSGEGLK